MADARKLSVGGWCHARNLVDSIPGGHEVPPWCRLATEFGRIFAACWYTFEALTDALLAAGEERRRSGCSRWRWAAPRSRSGGVGRNLRAAT